MRILPDPVVEARWRGPAQMCLWMCLLMVLPASSLLHAQGPPDSLSREPELERGEAKRLEPQSTSTQLILNVPTTLPPAAERQRLSQLRNLLSPATEPTAELRFRALEGVFDYAEEDQMLYSPGRTRVEYGRYMLEADKVILDLRLKEVQAEGNVVMKVDKDTIYGTSLRYNFDD